MAKKVIVIGPHGEFVSHTHPAKARKLVASGKAFILENTPFKIKLREATERTEEMPKRVINYTQLFKEEKDIYIQNVGKTQVSIGFEVAPGRTDSVCLPRTRKPFNLTSRIPWAAIKGSMDLRILLNRRPANIALLSEEEYLEYYKNMAKQKGTTMEQEIEEAFEHHSALMDRRAFTVDEDSTPKTIEEARADQEAAVADDPEEQITPSVIGLMQRIEPGAPAAEKLGIYELIEELEVLGDDLTSADCDYIEAKGTAKVKKWIRERVQEANTSEDDK